MGQTLSTPSAHCGSLGSLESHALPQGIPAKGSPLVNAGRPHGASQKVALKPPLQQRRPGTLRSLESQGMPAGTPAKDPISAITSPPLQRRFDESSYIGKPSRRREINEVAKILMDSAPWWITDGTLHIYGFHGHPVWSPIKDKDFAANVFRNVLRHRNDITSGLCPDDYNTLWYTLRTHPDLTVEGSGALGDHENLLNCRDGVIDVLSPSLDILKHDPAFHFRSYVDVSCFDIQRCHSDCEYRESFCNGYFSRFAARMSNGDPRKVQMLLELAAFVAIEHLFKGFYLLYGPHSTGKSQWGKFLKWLAGDHYTHALEGLHSFGDKYTMGDLYGKKLALGLEVPQESRISSRAVGGIKTLTGDDPINARVKYGHSFTYDRGRPMLVFASNFPIYAADEAFMDRMYVIPFDASPVPKEEQVRELHKHLRGEAQYILYESILAFQAYVARSAGPTRVELPPEWCHAAPRSPMDSICNFLNASVTREEDAQPSTYQLYQAYLMYTGNATLSFGSFGKFLPDAIACTFPDAEYKKALSGSKNRGYRHLALKPLE